MNLLPRKIGHSDLISCQHRHGKMIGQYSQRQAQRLSVNFLVANP